MKFDRLVNNIITELVNEGRTPKTEKYANISVDAEKLLQKLNAGDFDILIKSWANNPRYANLSEERVREVIQKVGEDIKEKEPVSFSDLKDNIEFVVDKFYENKGPKRKTYDERLTKAVTNLILHKEYELISMAQRMSTPQEEEEKSYDIENMTKIESAIYEFVSQSEEPTTMQEIDSQFPQSKSIVDSLIEKGFLEKIGNTIKAKEKNTSEVPLLDVEDEEEEEKDALSYDPDIESTFKNTFGRSSEFEDSDYSGGSDYVPSWQR